VTAAAGGPLVINPFKSKDRASLVALIAANLVPLGGVIFAGWDAGMIVLLYWVENLILGFYNVLKMALVPMPRPLFHLGKLFIIPFFCLHYGWFCGGHGFFILALFGLGDPAAVMKGVHSPGPLVFMDILIGVVTQLLAAMPSGLLWPVAALFISHGVSFVQNYLLGREYASFTLKRQMDAPYRRIVILHVAIIAGMVPVLLLQSPLPLLVAIVLLKTWMDVHLHVRSHRRKTGEETPPEEDGTA